MAASCGGAVGVTGDCDFWPVCFFSFSAGGSKKRGTRPVAGWASPWKPPSAAGALLRLPKGWTADDVEVMTAQQGGVLLLFAVRLERATG